MKNKLKLVLFFLLSFSIFSLNAQTECTNEIINYNDGVNFLSLANAITPNGDGINDNIPSIFNNVVVLMFSIYDSEGNVIHTGDDNSSNFWDGANAAPGQYTMFLNVEFTNGAMLTDVCRTIHVLEFDESQSCFAFDTISTPLLFADQFNATSFVLDPAIASNESICTQMVGIESLLTNQIKIGPNPANDFINISTDYKLESIQIFDTKGSLLLTNTNASKVDVSILETGIYFMNIQVEGQSIVKKFIVE